jgi:hypothetical protein
MPRIDWAVKSAFQRVAAGPLSAAARRPRCLEYQHNQPILQGCWRPAAHVSRTECDRDTGGQQLRGGSAHDPLVAALTDPQTSGDGFAFATSSSRFLFDRIDGPFTLRDPRLPESHSVSVIAWRGHWRAASRTPASWAGPTSDSRTASWSSSPRSKTSGTMPMQTPFASHSPKSTSTLNATPVSFGEARSNPS